MTDYTDLIARLRMARAVLVVVAIIASIGAFVMDPDKIGLVIIMQAVVFGKLELMSRG